MSKLFGSPGRRPRNLRICTVMRSIARSTVTPGTGFTRMMRLFTSS
jgi:hypothetical protein